MARTPYHAFGDQLIPGRPQRGHLAIEFFRDVPGAMRPRTELGHRSQVFFLDGRKSVESHPEETFVERSDGFLRRSANILARDRRLGCYIPRMLAPFLQKIRVTVRLLHDSLQSIFPDLYALRGSRFCDRYFC